MVSKLLKFYFCLVFVAAVVHADWEKIFNELEEKLNKMAKIDEKIDGLFKLVENGTVKRGGHGFVFKGISVEDNIPVALKFVALENRDKADIEFKMYGYLDGINKSHVEKYGISSLHYYQEWEGFMVSAFPFFDGGDLQDLYYKDYFNHKNANLSINSLILFRDFIMQSKYIHSRGIRHNSIKPRNIVIRNSRSFLIDFTSSTKMLEYSPSVVWPFSSRMLFSVAIPTPRSEWEGFLYMMAFINGIELGWMWRNPYDRSGLTKTKAKLKAVEHILNDTARTISVIENAPIACPVLKNVFILFAKDALKSLNSIPAYNDMYDVIVRHIEEKFGSQRKVMFTWLNDHQKVLAERDNNRCYDIRMVPEVLQNLEDYKYEKYSLDFFSKPGKKKRSFFGWSTSK